MCLTPVHRFPDFRLALYNSLHVFSERSWGEALRPPPQPPFRATKSADSIQRPCHEIRLLVEPW